jgi:hypothetical protein
MKILNKVIIFRLVIALSVIVAAVSLDGSISSQFGIASATTQKTFYIATVHLDGITSIYASGDHPAEPYPNSMVPWYF